MGFARDVCGEMGSVNRRPRSPPTAHKLRMNYYANAFPAETVFEFATLCSPLRPENVELATDAGGIWHRWQSVSTPKELRALLSKRHGSTLHLGAVYGDAAKRSRGGAPLRKALAFDLDLGDVGWLDCPKTDQSRTDRSVCVVFGMIHVLIAILRQVFGFEQFLPVYSGRRGAHLWVLDERACRLNNDARAAICAMINTPFGKDGAFLGAWVWQKKNPCFSGLQGESSEVEVAVEEVWKRIVLASAAKGGLGLFDSTTKVTALVQKLFDTPPSKFPDVSTELKASVVAAATNRQTKGRPYEKMVGALQAVAEDPKARKAANIEAQIRLKELTRGLESLTWPKLDHGPTAQMGHCVKAPFSLHGSTNRVALPMQARDLLPLGKPALPIVTLGQLKQGVPDATQRMQAAVETMHSALASARPSVDIEDMGGKRRRRA